MVWPHSLGPWSVMQAALQGGAAISRPSIPCVCARVTLLWVRSRAVVGVASDSPSNSAATRYLIFIVGLLDCGPRATRGAPELPWHKRMPVSGRMTGVRVGIFPNTQLFGILQTVAVTAVGRVHWRASRS